MPNELTSANILSLASSGLEPGRLPSAAKEAFRSLLNLCGFPPGGWSYLESSDFFLAPASCRHHGNWQGGLAEHSLMVLHQTVRLCGVMGCALPGLCGGDANGAEGPTDGTRALYLQDMAIAALLHDVAKANYYEVSTRNVKQGGQWVQEPFFRRKPGLAQMPHGMESLDRIGQWRQLSEAWRSAVVHHMGAFDSGNVDTFSESCRAHPEVLTLHTADMWAAQVRGV